MLRLNIFLIRAVFSCRWSRPSSECVSVWYTALNTVHGFDWLSGVTWVICSTCNWSVSFLDCQSVNSREAAMVWIEKLCQNVMIVSNLSMRGLWPDRMASGPPPLVPPQTAHWEKGYRPNGKANDPGLFYVLQHSSFFFFYSVVLCNWSKWKDDMIRAHFFRFLNNLNADERPETLIKYCVLLNSCVYLSQHHTQTYFLPARGSERS